MSALFSFSFLILVIADAVVLFLSYLVFRSDTRSATTRIFSLLGLFLSAWLAVIVIAPDPQFALHGLLLARLTLFLITPVNVLFFLLAGTFPDMKLQFSRAWTVFFAVVGAVVMAVTLSPYAFTGARIVEGVQQVNTGPGLAVFGLFSVFLNVGAIVLLVRKMRRAQGEVRAQIRLEATGIAIMFGLIIATIFLPVFIFKTAGLVPLAPLYALVFLGMTAYAIVKHHMFNLKVIATEAFVAILWIALFANIWASTGAGERVIDGTIFLASIVFGVLLVRSVRAEVRQREAMQELNGKIQAANMELQRLNRFKSELLSLASHQIRSPLAAIKGFVSLVMDGSYGAVDPGAKEALGKVKRSAEDLIGLINTLLDVRRVEEGRMEYQFAPCDLGALVHDVAEELRPLAEEKHLAFTLEAPGRPLSVSADRQKLAQVIQNLVDNAIKYTPSGSVKVSVAEAGEKEVAVTVADTGLGIPKGLVPYLFEEFIRDDRVKKDIRGTGLGLYIARSIVEAHHGTISADSGGEGKGSVFRLVLPKSGDLHDRG